MSLRTTRQFIDTLGTGDSSLRTTRQQLDVLGRGDKNLRVTRQFIDILLSDNIIKRSLTETLILSDTVDYLVDRNPKVYDTLIFVEQVPAEFYQTVTDTLILTDSVARIKDDGGTDSLEFVDTTDFFQAIQDFWPTGDYLSFDEIVDIECGNWKYVPQTLTFTETIEWHGSQYVEITHYISFRESVWNNNNWRRIVNDVLTLTQYAGRPYSVTISDSLIFTEEGRRRADAVDSLTFNELVLNGKGAPVEDILSFNQTNDLHGSFVRVVAENLNLGQSVAYYYITPCIDKQYHPFIGDSNVLAQPTAPDIDAPIIQGLPANTRFQLLYPAAGGVVDSLTLRAPELDSHDRNAFNRVNRETRGGKLVVFADPIWPKVTTITCTFIGLTKSEISALQTFILSHIGEEIKIIDWEGCGWRGVVIKPNDTATCDGKNRWSIGFEFEGSRIENYDSGLSLVFSDTVNNIVFRRPILTDLLIFNQVAIYQVN